MKIGIDFDNTIISYDAVFHAAAIEWGYDVALLDVSKTAVRDHLRGCGDEEKWIELQGYVYGKKMAEARPFEGVLDFFDQAKSSPNIELCIVSHKTRHPFRGPKYDLHEATKHWLTALGLSDSDRYGIGAENIFLELTKEDKATRIESEGCNVFIDDLPEFLKHEAFPVKTRGMLFDPSGLNSKKWEGQGLNSWSEFLVLLSE